GCIPPHFVPGHPIAGSERSGVEAADAQLFRNHKVILTPLEETGEPALALVRQAWRALGADVEDMPLADHDEVLAATSHLPHLLAFSLVAAPGERRENLVLIRLADGGIPYFIRLPPCAPGI